MALILCGHVKETKTQDSKRLCTMITKYAEDAKEKRSPLDHGP